MTRFSRLIESIGQQRDKVIEYQTRMTELPALGPENGGTGEMPKALYLEGLLRELGVTDILRIDAPDPRVPDGVRPNVVARIPGASPRRLWILGHMDVVPPGELSYWKTDPWKVVVDGDKIRGRGVEDNQQAIVCGLLIAQELKAQGITPDLSLGLIFVSDEETSSRYGIHYILKTHADLFGPDDFVVVPDYCVRITGSDVYGKSKLDYFISVSSPYPVIATTSELLSTGADCKMTKLIVLDKTVESMTTFKQIIGRGTRIREKEGKTHFVVMDFRNVTRLFSDPDWDGPVEQDEGFQHGGSKPKGGGGGQGGGGKEPPVDPVETPIVDKDGCRVKIINKTVSVYDANGKLLRQEDIIDYTRTNIKGEYASLSDFIRKWKASDKKKTIEESFMTMGIDLKALKVDQGMKDVDDFDFICYVAYGKKPLTRKERAKNVKKKDFFSKYSADAQAVLDILLDKYMNQGITEVEDIKVLSLADFANYGKPAKIVKLFGGKAQYEAAVRELEASIYEEVEVG